jgi:hypothetical protein
LIPAEQVESIEIMKGAASTLYGSVVQQQELLSPKKSRKESNWERPT